MCLGTRAYPQTHEDRYGTYILNTVLGGNGVARSVASGRAMSMSGEPAKAMAIIRPGEPGGEQARVTRCPANN